MARRVTATRWRKTRTRTALGSAVALFLVICGALLVLLPRDEAPQRALGEALVQQVSQCVLHNQHALRALEQRNYGQVHAQLKRTQQALLSLKNGLAQQ